MSFDLIVIGGGHSGSEAATAAARLGARVLLLTSNLETIGQMSCNPAIGGIAKGTVAREVDALGGVMGRATDRACLQFRMLNRSKGPAVWAPRAQCDRSLYRLAMRQELERFEGIEFLQGTAAALLQEQGRAVGVRTTTGVEIRARAVVVTAGTFLRGRIHMGRETQIAGGRAGDPAAVDLAEQLEAVGLEVDRFKTGTPPRIDGRSVDYAKLERQDGEREEFRFSHYTNAPRPGDRPCWITWAGPEVKEIIQANLGESALYGGAIAGRGPRYCPSVEDKIVKFPNAERHQVFLEPEGLHTDELYVNGLSTSLPAEVQEQFLRQVPGLGHVRMTRPGYAIEYDYYPPHQLTPWLEVKAVPGLFFAGQINGTTGYEEAAAQGVAAGINAVHALRGDEPVVFTRDQAYIGVLTDDLVTRGVDEPYRLFTSRAEYRLLLRQDNALARLGPMARKLGLLTAEEWEAVEQRLEMEDRVIALAHEGNLTPEAANPLLESAGERPISERQKVIDLVRRPGMDLRALLLATGGVPSDVTPEAWHSAEIEIRYEGYLLREREAAARLRELADFALPDDLQYLGFLSLSTEARQKLHQVKPGSLGQASRIPGVSPSDLQAIVHEVVRRRRASA
ncbi:MAG: tRNA uridine-5-carboxymethylaminomethyl(34) synthesis enzyme MnmG [Gemmatimonadota bacterium]|nr:tRNA uridine-5-carboxymethylaminomethyl(34) synthesis enzyme MnmG [Gemmatimonadota bacterium]MDH4349581.1 tRNA uridine-5-carboxymethylaminomethyl(34) synthesis enzyme MnmG [Gemmatimonadota bacterium]